MIKKTKDIYFASALSALGATLEEVDKSDEKHMVFGFSPSMTQTLSGGLKVPVLNLDQIERDWANRTLIINAVDYAEAIKRMKSVVHSSK